MIYKFLIFTIITFSFFGTSIETLTVKAFFNNKDTVDISDDIVEQRGSINNSFINIPGEGFDENSPNRIIQPSPGEGFDENSPNRIIQPSPGEGFDEGRVVDPPPGKIDNSFINIPGERRVINNDSRNTRDNSSDCGLGTSPKFGTVLSSITCIISGSVIPLIFALALATFLWGIVQYVMNSEGEVKKEEGRQFMVWGIIALSVMISVWGLVKILGETFGIEYAAPRLKEK
jgi:hypothetical protein